MILTFRALAAPPPSWKPAHAGRPPSPFTATYSDTLTILERELHAVAMKDAFLQVLLPDERGVRLDGQLRADARVEHPGVILTVDTRTRGTLVFSTDRFAGSYGSPGWHANLRAIALGLEALRKVERYGIAETGQQYAGYRELPPSSIELGPAMTLEEAARLLCDATMDTVGEVPQDLKRVASMATSLWREAAKTAHPDAGGDPEVFRRLTAAKDLLVGWVR